MKNTLIISVLMLAGIASGQTALTATITTAAMTSTQNYAILSSTSGIADKSQLLIQDIGGSLPELVTVRGACSSTQCTIVRTGQKVRAHVSGAMVLISPLYGSTTAFGQWVQSYNPTGACTTASTLFTPWVNSMTGEQFLCSAKTLSWIPGFGTANIFNAQVNDASATASVGGTTAISGPLTHISGTNAITAFSFPPGWNNTGFCIIPDAAYTTTTGGTTVAGTRVMAIAVASTGVLNKVQCYVYDAPNAKVVPSY